jgi:hypothetical protein
MADAQFENEQRIKEETTKQTVSPVKSFLSGGFGGMSAVLVGKSALRLLRRAASQSLSRSNKHEANINMI